MSRPTLESLRINPKFGRDTIMFKEAQMGGPAGPDGGMPPEMGQSPVTGNPDEMQAPESANHKQYEDDFGALAYQFVQDRAPALLPYLIGFEIVDRNEDGSKAVGIFGYKVDDDFYYVPAFFLNNQVRGVDMVLNKKTNQFIPLTEKWIDFIIDRHSVSMGGPADSRVRDTMRNPDLSFVQRPQIGKMAGASEPATPWTFKEAWAQIKEATVKAAETPEFKEAFSGILGQAEKVAESSYIKNFMEKVGGPEAMLGFISAMKDIDFANAALSMYKDAEFFWTENTKDATIHVDRMQKKAAAAPKVRVVDSVEHLTKAAQDTPATDVGEEDKAFSDEENARQILEHDFTIEDTRKEDEVAKVTEDEVLVSFETRFNAPDEPGRYNILMSDGTSRVGVMLNTVASSSCEKDENLFVFDGEDGIVIGEASPKSLLVTDFSEDSEKNDTNDELEALFDKAKPISDIEIDDTKDGTPYLFIDSKGNAAGPFAIKFFLNDGDNTRLATGWCNDCTVKTHADSSLEPTYGFMDWNIADRFHGKLGRRDGDGAHGDPCCCESIPCNSYISIGTFSGLPKLIGDTVIIPQDWKVLKITPVPKRWTEYKENESDADRRLREVKQEQKHDKFIAKYTMGSAQTVLEEMTSQGVERVKIASDGSDYYLQVAGAHRQHGPMTYKQASIDLVTRFGLRPRRAFSILSKAASAGSAKMLVCVPSLAKSANDEKAEKQAQDRLVGVSMPAPQEQLPSVDPYTGIPVYSSPYIDIVRGNFTGVPGLPPEGGMTHGINIGGEMERNMGGFEMPDEHNDSLNGALPIDEEARRLAEEAAAAGQRHVFDQAAIGGLVKVYDVANVVDSYIPEFMDTIDRLGRILFLFYWKHEDFNQRYGSDDVVQMEDRLRNVFKSLGELALQLKEKSVQKE